MNARLNKCPQSKEFEKTYYFYKNNAGLHLRTDFFSTQNGHTHSLTCDEAKDNEIHIPSVILFHFRNFYIYTIRIELS